MSMKVNEVLNLELSCQSHIESYESYFILCPVSLYIQTASNGDEVPRSIKKQTRRNKSQKQDIRQDVKVQMAQGKLVKWTE